MFGTRIKRAATSIAIAYVVWLLFAPATATATERPETEAPSGAPVGVVFGEQYDPDLGLYYLRARYYSPSLGRFWSMDTWEGSNRTPLSQHKYLYTDGNPCNAIDPSGHFGVAAASASASIGASLQSLHSEAVSAIGFAIGDTAENISRSHSSSVAVTDYFNGVALGFGAGIVIGKVFGAIQTFRNGDVAPFHVGVARGNLAGKKGVFNPNGSNQSCAAAVAAYLKTIKGTPPPGGREVWTVPDIEADAGIRRSWNDSALGSAQEAENYMRSASGTTFTDVGSHRNARQSDGVYAVVVGDHARGRGHALVAEVSNGNLHLFDPSIDTLWDARTLFREYGNLLGVWKVNY